MFAHNTVHCEMEILLRQTQSSVFTHTRGDQGSPERGVRSWSFAEIRDDRWYQVETCDTSADGQPLVTNFVVTGISEALSIVHSLRQNNWTVLRLFCRLPLLAERGFVFDTITRVYAERGETHLFELESGLMLCEKSGALLPQEKFREMHLIYDRDVANR